MNAARIEQVTRIVLALMLAVFGANKFFHYLPQPEPPPDGGAFLGALMNAGYVFPVIGAVFLVSALLLLVGRVVLPVLLLAPIVVNILGYHMQFDPSGSVAGGVLAALLILLVLLHPGDFAKLLRSDQKDA